MDRSLTQAAELGPPTDALGSMAQQAAVLTGLPQTMLWTLHNRAGEALRSDGCLMDPEGVRIYRSIPYDYVGTFGPSDGSHAVRAKICDKIVSDWLRAHPSGTVVELGAGLETQFQRCDDGKVRWLCVDVPTAIEVRELLLPSSPRCRSIAASALDCGWMNEIDSARGVLVTAQGLFMYLERSEVQGLFAAILDRFANVELVFDVIPRWYSRKTLTGFQRTKTFKVPPMPWGANRCELESLLRGWSHAVGEVRLYQYGYTRGWPGTAVRVLSAIPGARNIVPTIAHVRAASRAFLARTASSTKSYDCSWFLR